MIPLAQFKQDNDINDAGLNYLIDRQFIQLVHKDGETYVISEPTWLKTPKAIKQYIAKRYNRQLTDKELKRFAVYVYARLLIDVDSIELVMDTLTTPSHSYDDINQLLQTYWTWSESSPMSHSQEISKNNLLIAFIETFMQEKIYEPGNTHSLNR